MVVITLLRIAPFCFALLRLRIAPIGFVLLRIASIRKGLASIIKNYAIHEASTMSFTLYHRNLLSLFMIAKYQPCETNVFNDISGYLDNIYIDVDGPAPVLYDIPSCNFTELRGKPKSLVLPPQLLNKLLLECADIMQKESTLYLIYLRYVAFTRRNARQFHNQFLMYIRFMLKDISEMRSLRFQAATLDISQESLSRDIELLEKVIFEDNGQLTIE